MHDKHNLATPSPVTDGTLVFAWFGTGQVVALDRTGAVVWQRHLATENGAFDIQWGHGSSPVLHGDLLILLCDQPARSYLLAIDKKTGKDRWKADRGQGRSSYSTPLVVEGAFGTEVIVNSTERIDAYDAKTGAFLWHTGETSRFAVPSPVFHDGVIYASRGYRSGPYMAIKPGGRGDVTSTQTVWRVATGAPYCLVAPVLRRHRLHGERRRRADGRRCGHGRARLAGAGGRRVLGVAGRRRRSRLLRQRERGHGGRQGAAARPQVVARNALGERAVASPAISNGQIFIRTDKHVFAIGETVEMPRSPAVFAPRDLRDTSWHRDMSGVLSVVQDASAARRWSMWRSGVPAMAARSCANGVEPPVSMTAVMRSSKSVAAADPSSAARWA